MDLGGCSQKYLSPLIKMHVSVESGVHINVLF
jgi:hypothetical protein